MAKNSIEYQNIKQKPFKYHYFEEAQLVGPEYYPKLKPTQLVPTNVISFNETNSIKNPKNYFLDFFIDDYRFEKVWTSCTRYLDKFKQFKGIITTDYSAYRDMPLWMRKYNVGRNRVIAYYLQKNKINIIPVASWAYLEDFDWCLEGLPKKASIAISANGCKNNFISYQTLIEGVEILQKNLEPKCLIICGSPIAELDEKYDNIYYYKSFSQRKTERIKNGF